MDAGGTPVVASRCFDDFVFFFNDTATTEIYTLSLHDALPIWPIHIWPSGFTDRGLYCMENNSDRKSTRLNSSHGYISYAVFCLKKQNALCQLLTPLHRRRPQQHTADLHSRL